MAITKHNVFIIFFGISIICCGNIGEVSSRNSKYVSLDPNSVLTYNLEELLEFTCSAVWDDIRLTSNNTNNVRFMVGYKLHDIEKLSFYLESSYCHDSYCGTTFNHTFEQLRSLLNSSNSEFDVDCIVFIDNERYGISSASVHYIEGKGLGENCSSDVRCNESANLTCAYNICSCKQSYILINATDNKQLCYSKAYNGDSCSYDEQCTGKNMSCNGNIPENKTCECIESYVYNGYYCCSNTSYWCSILWFDYDWISFYWTDIIVIMLALSLGLLILSIVIAISIALRIRGRRAGQQPLDTNFKSLQNYTPKEVFGHYFGKKGEDKLNLTENDYNNEQNSK